MAIRNDQYLFREGPGRGEISPQDPLETRLYDVNGNIYDKDNPFEVRVRKLEEILGLAEENPEQYTLAARLKRIEDMLESGSAKVTLTGQTVTIGGTQYHLLPDGITLVGPAASRPTVSDAVEAIGRGVCYWAEDSGEISVANSVSNTWRRLGVV